MANPVFFPEWSPNSASLTHLSRGQYSVNIISHSYAQVEPSASVQTGEETGWFWVCASILQWFCWLHQIWDIQKNKRLLQACEWQLCCELVSWREYIMPGSLRDRLIDLHQDFCTPQQYIPLHLWDALRSVSDQSTIYHPLPVSLFSNRKWQKPCMSVMPGSEGNTCSSCPLFSKCTAKFNHQNSLLFIFLHWFFFLKCGCFLKAPMSPYSLCTSGCNDSRCAEGKDMQIPPEPHLRILCSSPLISHILLSIFLPSIYFMMAWNHLSYIKNEFFTFSFIRLESALGRYQFLSKPDNFLSSFMRI